MSEKPRYAVFWDIKLEETFEKLKSASSEQQKLYKFINRAIGDLKRDPTCGTKIPKRLWPRRFIRTYKIDNLWKYDLPGAWRLIYTIVADKIRIVSVILEWGDHKWYDRVFGY